MARSIQELSQFLLAIRIEYKDSYKQIVAKRKAAEKELEENFKAGTSFYDGKKKEIKEDFEKAIAELKLAESDYIFPHFVELKEMELERTKKIDEMLLTKINAISNLPLTEEELKALNEKYNSKNDYWVNRSLAVIAEKNGIEPIHVGIEPTLDVKLGIVNSLQTQFETMLRDWDIEKKHNAEADAQLGDSTLEQAVLQYTNGYSETNKSKIAESAYLRVLAGEGQIEKAVLIGNSLKNMKEDARNEFLYRIAMDSKISEFSLQMSGCFNEVMEWKNGKASQYEQAVRCVKNIEGVLDETVMKNHLKENEENPFLRKMLQAEAKTNSVLRNVLASDSSFDNVDHIYYTTDGRRPTE